MYTKQGPVVMPKFRSLLAVCTVCAVAISGPVHSQGLGDFFKSIFGSGSTGPDGNALRATIWVDPDGCEHWVMDDGLEGFMSSHLDREGKPVCRSTSLANGTCRTFDSAALFKVGSATINAESRKELMAYFETIAGRDVIVAGHTDNTGSEKANLALSLKRAAAVAKIARAAGVNAEARGYGEQVPVASNDTKEGRARNRRVELSCS